MAKLLDVERRKARSPPPESLRFAGSACARARERERERGREGEGEGEGGREGEGRRRERGRVPRSGVVRRGDGRGCKATTTVATFKGGAECVVDFCKRGAPVLSVGLGFTGQQSVSPGVMMLPNPTL